MRKKLKSLEQTKFTILTPSFNQGDYIEQNILSVLDQDYPSIEHIIIDGGSTDKTIEILKRYPHLKWISEKDGGQADALNKGLKMATGDIVGWVNSDDYYESGIFNDVVNHFNDPKVQWVVGNITDIWDHAGIKLCTTSPVVTYKHLCENPDIVRQASTFFRKTALVSSGGWNSDLFMVMDYDLWLRLAKVSTPAMINANWAYFRWHPNQKSTSRNMIRQFSEIKGLLRREKVPLINRLIIMFRKGFNIIKTKIKEFLISVGILDKKNLGIPLSVRRRTESNKI